ncbi:MAG: hypothetical protein HKN75_07625 [Bacteroidia bacterium]|nr:hypothetical protein [Bacteroidia bacterium]
MESENKTNDALNESPPFFKTWSTVYLVVLAWLVILIIIFYLITSNYS